MLTDGFLCYPLFELDLNLTTLRRDLSFEKKEAQHARPLENVETS